MLKKANWNVERGENSVRTGKNSENNLKVDLWRINTALFRKLFRTNIACYTLRLTREGNWYG